MNGWLDWQFRMTHCWILGSYCMLMMPLFTLQVATLFIVWLEFFFRWFEFSFIYCFWMELGGALHVFPSSSLVYWYMLWVGKNGSNSIWPLWGKAVEWNGIIKILCRGGAVETDSAPTRETKVLSFNLFKKQMSISMRWRKWESHIFKSSASRGLFHRFCFHTNIRMLKRKRKKWTSPISSFIMKMNILWVSLLPVTVRKIIIITILSQLCLGWLYEFCFSIPIYIKPII